MKRELPLRQKPIIGVNIVTGHTIYFRSAYYAPGFSRNGIKEAISGRAKSHKGYVWRYASKEEREEIIQP